MRGEFPMASEVLNLTAQIVTSHASMTEPPLRNWYRKLRQFIGSSCFGRGIVLPETIAPVPDPGNREAVKNVESPEAKAVENEAGLAVGDPDYMEFMESREG